MLASNRKNVAGLLETARSYVEQVLQAPLLIDGPRRSCTEHSPGAGIKIPLIGYP